jgi:hypothetical protein
MFVAGSDGSPVPNSKCDFAGQCVCVFHPRLLLTATHVCFDDTGKQLHVRVGFKAEKDAPIQLFPATLIRWSGKMDAAVLMLDSAQSPFLPLPVATDRSISDYFDSGQICALASFAVSTDGAAIRVMGQNRPVLEVQAAQLTRLPFRPNFLESKIAAVQSRGYMSPSPEREFLIGISSYLNEKGVSGGAVVGMEGGRLVLFGIHIHNQRLGSSESYSYISSALQVGEFDGCGSDTATVDMSISQQQPQPHTHSGALSSFTSRSGTNSNHSVPDAVSPPLTLPVQSNSKGKGKGKSAESAASAVTVFVVAHSFLRDRWSEEQLLVAVHSRDTLEREKQQSTMNQQSSSSASPAAAATSARELSFCLPTANDSPSSSPRTHPSYFLYGDG